MTDNEKDEKERTKQILQYVASLTHTIKGVIGHAIGQAPENDNLQKTLRTMEKKVENLNRAQYLLGSQLCNFQDLPKGTYREICGSISDKESTTQDIFRDEVSAPRETSEEIEALRLQNLILQKKVDEAKQCSKKILTLQEDNHKAQNWMTKSKEKNSLLQQELTFVRIKFGESESRCKELAEALEKEKLERQLLAEEFQLSSARNKPQRQPRAPKIITYGITKEQEATRATNFLARFRAKINRSEQNSTPRELVCIAIIPLFQGVVSSYNANVNSNTSLSGTFAHLCLALGERQDLHRRVVQYDAAMLTKMTETQVAISIDYSSSLGNIARDADKATAIIDPMSLDFAELISASEREMLLILLQTNKAVKRLHEQGKHEEVTEMAKRQLREYLVVRDDAKAFLSVASKACMADCFHRHVAIDQILSKSDMKTAWRLFEVHSNECINLNDFQLFSSNKLRTFLRGLFHNTSVSQEDKRDATLIMLALISDSRKANSQKRKTAFPIWQNAQNFSAKTGEILPWTDLEGLLIRNGALPSDYTKSDYQTKQQRIATRAYGLATPEISNQLDSIFKENDVSLNDLESFAELILYSTSNDICEKFGMFEDPDFYNTNNGKTQAQLKTMKELAQNASRRKHSLRDFMQVANVTGPPEEVASKYTAFNALLSHLISSAEARQSIRV